MPLSSVIVGHKLKNEYPEIQFYPYFLDSLSGGRPIGIMSEQWNMKMKLKWEDRLLVNADKIIVMESSRAHHEKYNKNKCFYNKLFYLDIPLLSETHSDAIRRKKDDKINVIFCGTANYPMRNVKYFLDLVSRIKNDNIIFTFIGSSNYKPLTESKIKNVRYIPSVAHDMLTEYYLNADILFNLGVTTKSAISGKIFEYMSYGKPIISTYSIDDEACLPYLQKYQLSFLVDERSDITNEKAAELYNFIEENYNKRVDISYIKKIFYKNMPNTFVDEIFANR
jgi:glycosyltransferase involved in cell wall biosynthesis